ncbi:MAG: TolC family protein [Acidobacteria bacterium]|nr:TolC family protein [Acidobacteriota bacterium]
MIVALMTLAASMSAQAPAPIERLSFQQAVDRATRSHPSVAVAAAGILRAEGLLRQARATTRLQVTGNVTTTTLNTGVSFGDSTVAPQNQVAASLTADMPIVTAVAWARRAQAEDAVRVAELGTADARRQIALATADAYLSILAARRVVEANVRARDTARAHFDLATELEQRGTGSRLNALRAQQQVSIVQGLVEAANLAVYRAQEALGILVVSTGPVDATDEPTFDLPADVPAVSADLAPGLLPFRTDLKLFTGQVQAAQRVLQDSSRDRWPSLDAIFVPQSVYPAPFFSTANSWRLLLQGSIPLFDSGQRAALKVQRQATLDFAQATLAGGVTAASSQVRAAREAVASGERSLTSARLAADQAQQVVSIVNISFRAGAATNIEVIDAERSARDADTVVAIAEDTVRRSRLDLLAALGRFP